MLVIAAVIVLTLLVGIEAGQARELLGCDGVIQWPCPGPVPF
jgi:hypothetical protein